MVDTLTPDTSSLQFNVESEMKKEAILILEKARSVVSCHTGQKYVYSPVKIYSSES